MAPCPGILNRCVRRPEAVRNGKLVQYPGVPDDTLQDRALSFDPDGRLYEINDEAGKFLVDVTLESLVADWKANAG